MSNFKVGDNVVCEKFGEGVVYKVSSGGVFPIHVRFPDDSEESYTIEGKVWNSDKFPSLSLSKNNNNKDFFKLVLGEGNYIVEISKDYLEKITISKDVGGVITYTIN